MEIYFWLIFKCFFMLIKCFYITTYNFSFLAFISVSIFLTMHYYFHESQTYSFTTSSLPFLIFQQSLFVSIQVRPLFGWKNPNMCCSICWFLLSLLTLPVYRQHWAWTILWLLFGSCVLTDKYKFASDDNWLYLIHLGWQDRFQKFQGSCLGWLYSLT